MQIDVQKADFKGEGYHISTYSSSFVPPSRRHRVPAHLQDYHTLA